MHDFGNGHLLSDLRLFFQKFIFKTGVLVKDHDLVEVEVEDELFNCYSRIRQNGISLLFAVVEISAELVHNVADYLKQLFQERSNLNGSRIK